MGYERNSLILGFSYGVIAISSLGLFIGGFFIDHALMMILVGVALFLLCLIGFSSALYHSYSHSQISRTLSPENET